MSRTTTLVRFLLSAVLLIAALSLWRASGVADDLARRHEQIATFVDPGADAASDARWWTASLRTALDPEAVHEPAARAYWQGRYEAFAGRQDAARGRDDAASQLIAANAAFRQAQRQAGSRPSADELDRVLQGYASVLRNGGFDRDAAWNYEFVARLRDTAAREKPGGRPATGKPAAPSADARPAGSSRTPRADSSGLPTGPTVHGRPGTHPPSTKGEEFEVITPMDYGDREAQPEPTPGVKLPRKG